MEEARPLRELLELVKRKEAWERERAELNREAGERLRAARVSAGLTQAQVASAMGVSPPYVAKLESGTGTVSSAQLSAFVAVLDTGSSSLAAQHVAAALSEGGSDGR